MPVFEVEKQHARLRISLIVEEDVPARVENVRRYAMERRKVFPLERRMEQLLMELLVAAEAEI